AAHHVALALVRFGPDDGAGPGRFGKGTVGRVVVVDIDAGGGERAAEALDHGADRDGLVVAGEQDRDRTVTHPRCGLREKIADLLADAARLRQDVASVMSGPERRSPWQA